MQKRMSNIVKKTNEKEKLRKKFGSILDHPLFETRFKKMFGDNSKEMEKKYLPPHELSKYYAPTKPFQQQSRQERMKKDQEMEKQAVEDQELKRLANKARKKKKEAHKEYYGYGIVPPIYPSKILVNLVKLLTQIYEGYTSKKVVNETKRLLNTLYNNKIITETVYNHLANI